MNRKRGKILEEWGDISTSRQKKYTSREFKQFLESERLLKRVDTLYEKMCNRVEENLKIKLSPEQTKKFEEAIKFSYLKISPSGPVSLCVALGMIIFPVEILLLSFGIITGATFIVFLISTLFLVFYLYKYPFLLSRIMRSKASTELILTVLYMSISMREVPNLEKAIKFAASNLTGPISYDLKKLIWDINVGNYINAEAALDEFMDKWRRENQEFIDSLQLIKTSTQQSGDKRLKMLDESVEVILDGTSERMETYAQDLKMPIMLVYALGIVLPIMSLVVFPIVMIFLQDIINTSFMIIFYDLILPIFLYWFISMNLERKPPTMSQPDISKSFEVAPPGMFKIGREIYDIIAVSLIILIVFLYIGGYFLYDYHSKSVLCREWQGCNFERKCFPKGLKLDQESCKILITDFLTPTIYSSIIMWGISLSIISYCFLDTKGKTKLRDRVKKLEGEFTVALFQLGHQITTGHPIENALEISKQSLKKYEIRNFYEKILKNIRMFGMPFHKAIFDKEYGAIKFYPSELIRSVMRIISEASKKGIHLASISMLTISNYLKGMNKVEQQIKELLSDITSSMKFLSMALAPLVAGVTVAMAIIIMNILTVLSLEISTITEGISVPSGGFMFDLWKGTTKVTPYMFQLVLGIYIIETTVLLSIFINGIEKGEDKISEKEMLWKSLLFSTLIYTLCLFLVYMMFGGTIAALWGIG